MVPELANKLSDGQPLAGVRGLTFKDKGSIKSTTEADLIDLDNIPIELPYDLLKLKGTPHFSQVDFIFKPAGDVPIVVDFAIIAILTNANGEEKTLNM